jgi:hypothetical protein
MSALTPGDGGGTCESAWRSNHNLKSLLTEEPRQGKPNWLWQETGNWSSGDEYNGLRWRWDIRECLALKAWSGRVKRGIPTLTELQ